MKDIIRSYMPFSDDSFDLLMGIAIENHVKKNTILFKPSRPANKILFLTNGLLRGYKIIDGKDFTHHFYVNNWFATDLTSFLTEQPGELYIEAIEDSMYFEFNKKELNRLYKESHDIANLGRIMAEKAFLLTVEKLSNMQLHQLSDKYALLLEQHPDLIQRVPQKHIASYLGVSEQSLSRIKSQLIS